MREEDNIAKRVLELLSSMDITGIGQYLDDEIVWDVPYMAAGNPSEFRGKSAVLDALTNLPKQFESLSFHVHDLYSCSSPNAVILEATSIGLLKSAGGVYQNRYVFLLKFEDGKIKS